METPHLEPVASRRVLADVATDGFAIVRDVATDDDNAALIALALRLGRPLFVPAASRNASAEGGLIQRVEALPRPERDGKGFPIDSTTSDNFPLHTDCAYLAVPPDLVLLHCWRACGGGGATLLADARAIISKIAPSTLSALRALRFSVEGYACPAIATGSDGSLVSIRWSDRMLATAANGSDPRMLRSLEQDFVCTANALACSFVLNERDVLVVDNQRMLHGRTRFSPNSGRLLKRMRLYAWNASR